MTYRGENAHARGTAENTHEAKARHDRKGSQRGEDRKAAPESPKGVGTWNETSFFFFWHDGSIFFRLLFDVGHVGYCSLDGLICFLKE